MNYPVAVPENHAVPFVRLADVEPGQPFWLFLDPDTVTGLRHVGTHPAFTAAVKEKLL